MEDDLVVDPETGEVLDCTDPPTSAAEGESHPCCAGYNAMLKCFLLLLKAPSSWQLLLTSCISRSMCLALSSLLIQGSRGASQGGRCCSAMMCFI